MEALGYTETFHHEMQEYPPRETIPVALISIPLLAIPVIIYFGACG